jgi:hypothetical protein
MGSKVASIAVLAIVGVIIADVLIHPHGAAVAGNVANTGLRSTYSALLGKAPR